MDLIKLSQFLSSKGLLNSDLKPFISNPAANPSDSLEDNNKLSMSQVKDLGTSLFSGLNMGINAGSKFAGANPLLNGAGDFVNKTIGGLSPTAGLTNAASDLGLNLLGKTIGKDSNYTDSLSKGVDVASNALSMFGPWGQGAALALKGINLIGSTKVGGTKVGENMSSTSGYSINNLKVDDANIGGIGNIFGLDNKYKKDVKAKQKQLDLGEKILGSNKEILESSGETAQRLSLRNQNKKLGTSNQIRFAKEGSIIPDDKKKITFEPKPYTAVQDNTYVAPRAVIPLKLEKKQQFDPRKQPVLKADTRTDQERKIAQKYTESVLNPPISTQIRETLQLPLRWIADPVKGVGDIVSTLLPNSALAKDLPNTNEDILEYRKKQLNPYTSKKEKINNTINEVIPLTNLALLNTLPIETAGNMIKSGKNLIKPVSKVVNKTDDVSKNLKDLEYAKDYYSKYGYNIPENLAEIAKNSKLTDETIQGLVNQHNTFVRGVSTNWDEIAKKNPEILRHLEGKGIDYINNPQAAAEYMSTHVPIQTGYGRAGFGKNLDNIDAIYTSNSIPTAEGYTYGDGYIVKIKRPTDFSSKDRIEWIKHNDFDYDNIIKTPDQQSFNDIISLKNYYQNNIDKIDDILPSNYSLTKEEILNLPQTLRDNQIENILKEIVPKEKLSLHGYDAMEKPIRKMESRIDFNSNDYHDLIEDIEDNDLYYKILNRFRQKEKELDKNFISLNDNSGKYKYGSYDWYKARVDYQTKANKITSENKNEYLKILKNEFGIEPNRYAHYLHIGTPGQKLLEPIEATKITPDIWKNKSRAHTNVFSKGLSAGSLIPFYLYSQSQNQNKGDKIFSDTQLEEARKVLKFKKGGNLIPEGALHARKHELEIEGITNKGIPIITEEDGKIEQHMEIERNEIIFSLEVTKKLEELAKLGTDDAAIEAGKLLTYEIMENTEDRTNLIQSI